MFDFDLVAGPAIRGILHANRSAVIDLVRRAYLNHHAGETVNPDSQFLRFKDKPEARIIALPAFLGADVQLAGIKWISSFPGNITSGLPRASAVLILNDCQTGYPIACLEAATISAARTAASAAIAALALRPTGYSGTRIALIGAGVIARNVCEYLHEIGCVPDSYLVHDINEESGQALVAHLNASLSQPASFVADLNAVCAAETVIFTTTATVPYVTRPFEQGQVILNLSLRDIHPHVVLSAANILDDVDHCLKASTSPHLAEQVSGARDFVTGTLAQVLAGELVLPVEQPVIFSPFGLGVLDVAVGAYVHAIARSTGAVIAVPDFFAELSRW